jgi:PAS domain-containing protein
VRQRTNTRHDSEAEANAEERLRLIIDTIPAIIWRKFPHGSADFLNQRRLVVDLRTQDNRIHAR